VGALPPVTSRIPVGGVCLQSLWLDMSTFLFLGFVPAVTLHETSPTTPDYCNAFPSWSSNHSDASAVNPAQVEMDVDVDGLGGRVDWWGNVFHGEIVRM